MTSRHSDFLFAFVKMWMQAALKPHYSVLSAILPAHLGHPAPLPEMSQVSYFDQGAGGTRQKTLQAGSCF